MYMRCEAALSPREMVAKANLAIACILAGTKVVFFKGKGRLAAARGEAISTGKVYVAMYS